MTTEQGNAITISKVALTNYKNYHFWMLIPFIITILGFSFSYYLNFTHATWHQHVHGISATLWYMLVIVQPYLITRKHNIQRHKTLGIIGIMIAGIVAGSAFSIIPKNIDNVKELKLDGFFNPTIAYFVTLLDVILVCMFVLSVCSAILNIRNKNLAGHVQWLMASVFFVLAPALLRMIGLVAIFANKGNIEGIMMVKLAIPTMIAMIALITLFYYKFGSFKHLSFKLLIISQLLCLFVEQIGDNEFIRKMLSAIFKT